MVFTDLFSSIHHYCLNLSLITLNDSIKQKLLIKTAEAPTKLQEGKTRITINHAWANTQIVNLL